EDRSLTLRRRGVAEVPVRRRGCRPAPRRSLQIALLYKERLVDLLQRAGVFAHGYGDGTQAHRASLEFLDDGLEDPRVHVVEPVLIDVEPRQGVLRDRLGDRTVRADLRVIAY